MYSFTDWLSNTGALVCSPLVKHVQVEHVAWGSTVDSWLSHLSLTNKTKHESCWWGSKLQTTFMASLSSEAAKWPGVIIMERTSFSKFPVSSDFRSWFKSFKIRQKKMHKIQINIQSDPTWTHQALKYHKTYLPISGLISCNHWNSLLVAAASQKFDDGVFIGACSQWSTWFYFGFCF